MLATTIDNKATNIEKPRRSRLLRFLILAMIRGVAADLESKHVRAVASRLHTPLFIIHYPLPWPQCMPLFRFVNAGAGVMAWCRHGSRVGQTLRKWAWGMVGPNVQGASEVIDERGALLMQTCQQHEKRK
jgi:hypothetical protein